MKVALGGTRRNDLDERQVLARLRVHVRQGGVDKCSERTGSRKH